MMTEEISMNSTKACLLKECYDLALRFEKNDLAKEVLRKKSKGLNIPMAVSPVRDAASHTESDMEILSEVMYELACESSSASGNTGFNYSYKVDSLPDSAEKEFVLTLITLRNGTDETQRLQAMRHIRAALSYSPGDPRLVALAEILQQAANE